MSESMTNTQKTVFVLVWQSMIEGNPLGIAKSLTVMAAESNGSVEWYLYPAVTSEDILWSLLTSTGLDEEGEKLLVAETHAEFGGLLEASEDDFVEAIARAKGESNTRRAIDREM